MKPIESIIILSIIALFIKGFVLSFSSVFSESPDADKQQACYEKTLRAFVMAGLFTNHNINFSDTTIQPYISNYCLFLANQTQNFTKNVTITNDTLKPFYENNTTPKSLLFLKEGE